LAINQPTTTYEVNWHHIGSALGNRQKKRFMTTKQKIRLLIGLVVLGFLIYAWITGKEGDRLTGTVVSVHDGDTITLLQGKTQYKIRLDGIDCPELGQAFGNNARQFTSDMVFQKKVNVYYSSKDRYRRYLGTVMDREGKNLNRELLKAGLAWHYKHYSDDVILAGLESKARRAKLGLWADPGAIPPWEFREQARE
jgi:micrococcal nuclease